jgi:peptidoglycan/LPS O-acetylase OafA/YrhL
VQRRLLRGPPASAWLVALIAWDLLAYGGALVIVHQTVEMLLAGGLLLRLRLAPDGWVGRMMETRPMAWFGKLSYSLYLWQQIFLVVRTPDWGVARRFPVSLVLLFGAALLSHFVVERPFLRLKERFRA